MPAKGTRKINEVQRKRIAVGRLKSETSKVTAAAVGVRPQTVDKIAIDPRTKSMIAELKKRHNARLEEMFSKSLKTIDHYIGTSGKKGTRSTEDGGLALRACAQTVQIITAGETKLDVEKGTPGDFTFQELLESFTSLRRERIAKGLPV